MSFEYTDSRTIGPVNQVIYTSWVEMVTLTDRSKSVRNHRVSELLSVFVIALIVFDVLLVHIIVHDVEIGKISSLFLLDKYLFVHEYFQLIYEFLYDHSDYQE